jgi:hypothetical protein
MRAFGWGGRVRISPSAGSLVLASLGVSAVDVAEDSDRFGPGQFGRARWWLFAALPCEAVEDYRLVPRIRAGAEAAGVPHERLLALSAAVVAWPADDVGDGC